MNCKNHQQCVQRALQKAEQVCQNQQLQFTQLRRQVLGLVHAKSHQPQKAYDLLAKLHTQHKTAKPPTVYRALQFWQQHGLVHKLNSQNAYVGCTQPTAHQACCFLLCSNCQEVQEYSSVKFLAVLQQLATQNGFLPQHSSVEISGLCQHCQPSV